MQTLKKLSLFAAILAAASVTARPSDEAPRRHARDAAPTPGSDQLHPDDGLTYYGGAKGTVLTYHPQLGLTPAKGPDAVRAEEEEDVGQEPEVPVKPPALADPDSVVVTQPAAGASVAEARPIGIAIAGVGGTAAAKPIGTAIVGPGGLAISRPVATAIAGIDLPEGALGAPGPLGQRGAPDTAYNFRAAEQESSESQKGNLAEPPNVKSHHTVYSAVPQHPVHLVPLLQSPFAPHGLFFSATNPGQSGVISPYQAPGTLVMQNGNLEQTPGFFKNSFPTLDEGALRVAVSPGALEGTSTFYQAAPTSDTRQLFPHLLGLPVAHLTEPQQPQSPLKGYQYGVNRVPMVKPPTSNNQPLSEPYTDTVNRPPLYGYVFPKQPLSPAKEPSGTVAVGPAANQAGKYGIMSMNTLQRASDPQQPVSTYSFVGNGQMPFSHVVYHPY